MLINSTKISELMANNDINIDGMCYGTGLSKKSFEWIMQNGSVSIEAAERIADVLGVAVGEIIKDDPFNANENCIEFLKNEKTATVTLSQRRYITRVKMLAAEKPDKCQVLAENKDGSIVAHIPARWIRINPTRELSEKQMVVLEHMRAMKAEKRVAQVLMENQD